MNSKLLVSLLVLAMVCIWAGQNVSAEYFEDCEDIVNPDQCDKCCVDKHGLFGRILQLHANRICECSKEQQPEPRPLMGLKLPNSEYFSDCQDIVNGEQCDKCCVDKHGLFGRVLQLDDDRICECLKE